MLNIGPIEIIVVFIVALLVIGPKRLPELARALGRAVGGFKRATDELRDNLDINLRSIDTNPPPPNTVPPKEEETETSEPKKEATLSTKEKPVNEQ